MADGLNPESSAGCVTLYVADLSGPQCHSYSGFAYTHTSAVKTESQDSRVSVTLPCQEHGSCLE